MSQIFLSEIPDDNSCLFNAIGFVLEDHSRHKAQHLRNVIAEYVLSHPEEYDAIVLGKSPAEYASWIKKTNSWGGAIELAIFSETYGVEIASFDVKTGRMDLFGEDKGYHDRVYLQYSGIHYDAFAQALAADLPESCSLTIFSASDTFVLNEIQAMVQVARQAHHYTDTANFLLRCEQCRVGIRGEMEATDHAKKSGHANFIEYQ